MIGWLIRCFRRRGLLIGPVLLYLFVALCLLWPYRGPLFRDAGDLGGVLGMTVEARNALHEHQFPIRVTPLQLDAARYPLFQYYANFPFTVSGALCLAGLNAYDAWKVATILALTAGGIFMYLSALRLTRRPAAAAVAGVVFEIAPYVMTDLNARGAYAEIVGMMLLPAVFYYTLRCVASRRWRFVFAAAVAWMLVGLSHNITYLYGVCFLGIFFLTLLPSRKFASRFSRLIVAGLVHAGLMVWYLVPQIVTLPSIALHRQTDTPMYASWLSTLDLLLAPKMTAHPDLPMHNFGFQIGWASLGGAILSLIGLFFAGHYRGRVRWVALRLLVLFALAFVMTWSPYDFWKYLAKAFWFVQFPYRLLVFTSFFGALLAACGLALCLGRWMRWSIAWLAIAATAFASASYMPRTGKLYPGVVEGIMQSPSSGGLGDYLLTSDVTARTGYAHPNVDLARPEFGLTRGNEGLVPELAAAGLNIPAGATGLHVVGAVAGDHPAARLEITVGKRELKVPVKPGPFEFTVPLTPDDASASPPPVLAITPRDAAGHFSTETRLTSVRYVGASTPAVRLVTAEEVRKDFVRPGRVTKCRFLCVEHVILQLPVIYYPDMLRVTDKGIPIPYRNVGRFIALDLPAGTHKIEVRYAGQRCANWTSLVACAVTVLGLLLTRRRRKRIRGVSGRAGPRFGILRGIAGCIAVFAGGAVALGWTPTMSLIFGAPPLKVVASRELSPQNGAAMAFDHNPETFWAANGATPVQLTIETSLPRRVAGLRLHARKTSLREGWHTVHATAYLGGWSAHEQIFSIPEASTQDAVEIRFPQPVNLDLLELSFSDPVLDTFAGTKVTENVVNPGYSEIEILWED